MPFPAEATRLFYMSIYGGFGFDPSFEPYLGLASGIVHGTNPPYGLADFIAVYPKFFGPATAISGTLVAGSPVLTIPAVIPGLVIGQLVAGTGISSGSMVFSIDETELLITLTQDATATGAFAGNIYLTPFIPLIVLLMYINLASASLMQVRWRETWPLAMALFIAHFSTLWMETETGPNSTAAQVATSGLQQGIIISQAAGDVSATTQPVAGLEDWGSMNLTQYGVQLATFAQTVGSGPVYFR